MAFAHSPKIVTDGMVFYYDTGNSKSYAGEPTENLANNADFSNGTTNWNGNQNVTLSVETIDETRLLKVSSNQTNSTPGLKSANIPVNGNTTYTLTIRAYKNDSQSAFMYATGNGTGGADIVWSTSSLNGPNPITTELTTISRTFTTPSDMTYIQVGFLWSAPLTTSEVYVEYVQLEQKSHATPFVNGTRSATEALKDFTKNATLDLSNVSFDSNAQMTFDGTDDWINVGQVNSLLGQTAVSVEFIVDMATALDSNDRKVFHYSKAGTTDGVFQVRKGGNNSQIMYQYNNAGTWYSLYLPNAITSPDTFNHFVFTHIGTEVRAYKNGEFITNGIFAAGLDWTDADALYIGYRAAAEYWKGDMPLMKFYNRALSAEEVQQNFNTIKGRFGI